MPQTPLVFNEARLPIVEQQTLALNDSHSQAIHAVDQHQILIITQHGPRTLTRESYEDKWVVSRFKWSWLGPVPRIGSKQSSEGLQTGHLIDPDNPGRVATLMLGSFRDDNDVLYRTDNTGVVKQRFVVGHPDHNYSLKFTSDRSLAMVMSNRDGSGMLLTYKDGSLQSQPVAPLAEKFMVSLETLQVTSNGEPFLIWQDNQEIGWSSLHDRSRSDSQRVKGWTNHIATPVYRRDLDPTSLIISAFDDDAHVYEFVTSTEEPFIRELNRPFESQDSAVRVQDQSSTWTASIYANASPSPGIGLAGVVVNWGVRVDADGEILYRKLPSMVDDGGTRAVFHGGIGLHAKDDRAVIASAFGPYITVNDVRILPPEQAENP